MRSYAVSFIAGFALDLLYCRWFIDVGKSRAIPAALASVAIGGCGLLGLGQALDNPVSAIFYLAGLAVGTVTAIKFNEAAT
jgi:hypothetical protein